ncbi:gluconate 5-dehydrogenase [Aquisphaera giovannonii]|uniref:Gluconate 5-dehydrogenase n=1 Tax=Aquisphaera giovannonii TaxID=406548 RepID=A0A5B9WFE3_9BACT|nr:SDR family NAD(P)-dependent oxidoreductase [Aquisphaera giovannonii]QEH38785.1 gluconate 5-dehydrogenase [Aquisphaera giovannonii]
MATADPDQDFSADEWAACLRVLEALREDPEAAPDPERVERLIARIYRKTRGKRRKASAESRRQDDRALVEQTGRVRRAPLPGSTPMDPAGGPPSSGLLRARSRRCYICKERYREVHFHYHHLCPGCARLNFDKRVQRADLSGRRAMVTGGRVKIGYQAALKLLRDGAEVVVTTRFPRDAALRYAGEPDFDSWRSRLRIEALDFRMLPEVLAFADRLLAGLPSLEILIHNAAQTVRLPADHFADAAALERMPAEALPANIGALLGVHPGTGLPPELEAPALLGGVPGASALGASSPALPVGPREEPIDRRESNSWTARLADVPPVELLEVLLINAAAPFLLTGRLKPLLLRSPFPDRYVLNVAGLDGQFGRGSKTDRHPHVNMSKAALNMMTRTSAADFARDGILMNSVDVGWITHEGAHSTRLRMRARGFVPPLDEVDGAARIYDPIVQGLRGHREHGHFFKDYRPTAW